MLAGNFSADSPEEAQIAIVFQLCCCGGTWDNLSAVLRAVVSTSEVGTFFCLSVSRVTSRVVGLMGFAQNRLREAGQVFGSSKVALSSGTGCCCSCFGVRVQRLARVVEGA